MHPFLTRFSAALLLLAAPANAEGLSCRVQVSYTCGDACEANSGPADLTLDITGLTGEFCRGESCNTGVLMLLKVRGQWDDADYLIFHLKGDKGSFDVSGTILPGAKTFAGQSDELGQITGICDTMP